MWSDFVRKQVCKLAGRSFAKSLVMTSRMPARSGLSFLGVDSGECSVLLIDIGIIGSSPHFAAGSTESLFGFFH